MKKLLSMLGAIGLVATSSSSVVACGSKVGDSDTNGPSKDDVAKWDEMVIDEFEALFEHTVNLMFDDDIYGESDVEHRALWDSFQNLIDATGLTDDEDGNWIPDTNPSHTYDWQPKDTSNFQNVINQWWTRDAYNLINYGIDRIKKDDASYKYWENPREERDGSTLLYDVKSFLGLFENKLSPVKDATVNVKFSEWDKLINKIK